MFQVPFGKRDTDAVGDALAQRAGGYIHPGQDRSGVALKTRTFAAVGGHEFLFVDRAGGEEHRVQQGEACPLEKIRWSLAGFFGLCQS